VSCDDRPHLMDIDDLALKARWIEAIDSAAKFRKAIVNAEARKNPEKKGRGMAGIGNMFSARDDKRNQEKEDNKSKRNAYRDKYNLGNKE
jgi:hypothetical protein